MSSTKWDALFSTTPKNQVALVDGQAYKLKIKEVKTAVTSTGKAYIRITANLADDKGPWVSKMIFANPENNLWISELGKLNEVLGIDNNSIKEALATSETDKAALDIISAGLKPGLTFNAVIKKDRPYEGKDQWTWNSWSVSKFDIQQPKAESVDKLGTTTTKDDLDNLDF